MPTPASELEREQEHLQRSREQLGRMRERTASMDAAGAADWVSREYLAVHLRAADAPARRRPDRAAVLRPARLRRDGERLPHRPPARVRAGRRADGRRLAGRRSACRSTAPRDRADGRRPAAALRLPAREAHGLRGRGPGRRRPAIEEYSAILEAEIERPRVGPMRDIVATIQPEQDVIVRADVEPQHRRAGRTGHRQDGRRAAPRGVPPLRAPRAAPPPGRAGGRPQRQLPALHPATCCPRWARSRRRRPRSRRWSPRRCAELNPKWTIRGADRADVATLKGDGRLAAVLARAVWAHVGTPTEGLVRAARRAPVPGRGVRGRGGRRGAARPRGAVRRRPRDAAPGARPPDPGADGARRRLPRRPGAGAVARSKPVKEYAAALWPAVDPAKLVHRLLSDADALAAAADGILTDDEQRLLLWDKPQGLPRHDAVVAGRRRAPRRGRRPGRADAVARPHRGRRGAGPVADDAARDRPPLRDRLADRARRPGPGDDPVGDPVVGRGARPPRQAARRTSRSSPAASGCPARSSSTPPGCCRTSRRTWPRRPPCAAAAASSDPATPAPSWPRGHRGAGPRGVGRADRAGRAGSTRPSARWPPCRTPCSAATCPTSRWRPSSTPASTSCRRRWRRAWSSTTSCCSSPRPSWPASPTG